MANYCGNQLRVSAPNGPELDRFLGEIAGRGQMAGEALSFARILPVPADLPERVPEAHLSASLAALRGEVEPTCAYTWRMRHWGTTREASVWSTVRDDDANTAVIGFDTAWSPPTAVVIHLGQRFTNLELTLLSWEPSNDYAGKLRVVAGAVVERTTLDGDDAKAMLGAEGLADVWPEWDDGYE